MSYEVNEYLMAARILIEDVYENLKNGKLEALPTSEQLKEPIRIAVEAFFLSDYKSMDQAKSIENIIRTLYIENKPVSLLNPIDVLSAADSFESMIPKKMHPRR